MSTKKCKDDEILNPVSNRCVKRSGVIGKKILSEIEKSRKPRSKKECAPHEIFNPKTNRCVRRKGPAGRKLLNKFDNFKQALRELIENKKVETKRDIKKILKERDIDYSNYNLKEIIIDILDEILIENVKELIESGKVNTLLEIKKELKKRNIEYDNRSLKEIVIDIIDNE